MKVKLLRKLKKAIRKHMSIDHDFLVRPLRYDAKQSKYIEDRNTMSIVQCSKPIAPQLWTLLDMKSNWFMRYWKHSRWRSKVQVLAAANGTSEQEAAAEVLEERRSCQAKHSSMAAPSLHEVVPTLIPESSVYFD